MRDLQLTIYRQDGLSCVTLSTLDGVLLCEAGGPNLPTSGAGLSSNELRDLAWPGEIYEALQQLCRREKILLRLNVDSEFSNLPWESLEIAEGNPIWIRGRGTPGKLPARGLRVLVVWSNPASPAYPELASAEKEADETLRAFQSTELRSVQVKELANANEKSIENRIRNWKPHVIHFIGHCDVGVLGGFLVAEAGPNEYGRVWGQELARWAEAAGTQLVVLSGCCSAIVAQDLSQTGIPVVIGMREPVRDRFAYAFSRAFYASLASRVTISDAIDEARSATRGYGDDWSLPVLFSSKSGEVETEDVPPNNIPRDHRPFIGRTRQRAEIAELLTSGKCRYLTIHGMGGMGKTRLSCQVGLDVLRSYSDGVWFVECDNLAGEDQLVAGIAGAMGAPNALGLEGVCDFLGDGKTLIIADCFEKMVEHSDILKQVLDRCPHVDILVTSRIALDHAYAYKLDPLADRKKSSPSERLELFESAVRAINPEFRVTRTNAKICREIVMLLQGVPLAILLAAGRLRHLSLEQLRDRLKESLLDILSRTGGKRDRHASMRIVVSDSFTLLPVESQQLAVKLSIFAGGFTMVDARAVLPDEKGLEDGVFTLCDHSLLTMSGTGSETRYRALDTIREFLGEAAVGIEIEPIQTRHMTYFAGLSAQVLGAKQSKSWREAAELLRENLGNFLQSWRAAVARGESEVIRLLASNLARPFLEIGLREEFLRLAEEGLRLAKEANDIVLESELTGLLASQAGRDGRYQDSERLWRRKLELCVQLGDKEMAAEIHLDLALMYLRAKLVEDALRVIEEIDFSLHPTIHADALSLKAQILAQMGRAEEASAIVDAAVATSNSLPALSWRFFHMNLATACHLLGSIPKSLNHAKNLLSIALEYGFDQPAGEALLLISRCFCAQEEEAKASMACWSALCMPRAASTRVWKEAKSLADGRQWSTPTSRESKTWPLPARQVFDTLLLD